MANTKENQPVFVNIYTLDSVSCIFFFIIMIIMYLIVCLFTSLAGKAAVQSIKM